MPPNVDIRPYTSGDKVYLVSLWNDAMWADPIDVTTWRSRYLLDPNFTPGECLVAVDPISGAVDGSVLGFTDGGPPAPPRRGSWDLASVNHVAAMGSVRH